VEGSNFVTREEWIIQLMLLNIGLNVAPCQHFTAKFGVSLNVTEKCKFVYLPHGILGARGDTEEGSNLLRYDSMSIVEYWPTVRRNLIASSGPKTSSALPVGTVLYSKK